MRSLIFIALLFSLCISGGASAQTSCSDERTWWQMVTSSEACMLSLGGAAINGREAVVPCATCAITRAVNSPPCIDCAIHVGLEAALMVAIINNCLLNFEEECAELSAAGGDGDDPPGDTGGGAGDPPPGCAVPSACPCDPTTGCDELPPATAESIRIGFVSPGSG